MKASVRGDLLWVGAATLAAYALGSAWQWREGLSGLLEHYEHWQVDELPLAITVMALGLAWQAWRRHREVARLLRHNRELARQLLNVQERERQALARELHDELAQHCAAIRLEAAVAERCAELVQAQDAARRAAASAHSLQVGVQRLLRRLRPADLDALGLCAALRTLCAQRPWPSCRFATDADEHGSFGEDVDMALYRVAQEALSNVLRHAHATAVDMRLDAAPGGVRLSVRDDGLGFDADTVTGGLGLLGARERAVVLGGELSVHSVPGQGTRVELWLPLNGGPA
ncbi:sensor histidine kinase [Roseateles sp.]|uniref:sensor histidine kinase n=1 Tax=Roseateles sp. TaxID=1971397 RepID=UPI0025E18955|nr:sensor histidine kinase [Roseateles sp.]MBV8037476.1 sensor histidine kinase [Roseateles sp.]